MTLLLSKKLKLLKLSNILFKELVYIICIVQIEFLIHINQYTINSHAQCEDFDVKMKIPIAMIKNIFS